MTVSLVNPGRIDAEEGGVISFPALAINIFSPAPSLINPPSLSAIPSVNPCLLASNVIRILER